MKGVQKARLITGKKGEPDQTTSEIVYEDCKVCDGAGNIYGPPA